MINYIFIVTALKRLCSQKTTKNSNNNEYKNIKSYMESKNRKEKQNKEIYKGKENIKIKNLRIKKWQNYHFKFCAFYIDNYPNLFLIINVYIFN